MSASFWWFLAGSLLAFLPAYFDHGGTWKDMRDSQSPHRVRSFIKLCALWLIPVSGLVGTMYLGGENIQSDSAMEDISNNVSNLQTELSSTSNELFKARRKLYEYGKKADSLSNSIVNLDPMNQPVADVSVSAVIVLDRNSDPENPNWKDPASTMVRLGLGDGPITITGKFDPLLGSSVARLFSNGHFELNITYHTSLNDLMPVIENFKPLSVSQAANRINEVDIALYSIPPNAGVLGGRVNVLINGSVLKTFVILAQSGKTNYSPNSWLVVSTTNVLTMSTEVTVR